MLSVTRSRERCIWGAVERPSRGECAADSLPRASEGGGDVRVCRRSQNKHIRFSSGRVYWQSLFFKCLGFEWIILHCHLSTGLWWQTSPSLGCREKMPPPELGNDLQSVAPTPAGAAEKKTHIHTHTYPLKDPQKNYFKFRAHQSQRANDVFTKSRDSQKNPFQQSQLVNDAAPTHWFRCCCFFFFSLPRIHLFR